MKGIDVSKWQGVIDWNKVKQSGITFAILKAGGSDKGFYTDPQFERNYKNAKTSGLHVGAYYFVGPKCKSKADGKADAVRFKNIIKGKQFDFPVYIDFEAPNSSNIEGNTEACIGFCEEMEGSGYFCGIYASDISGFVDKLNRTRLTPFSWWVARYGSRPVYATKSLGIWQYSSSGRVLGISGNVDMDEAFTDFSSVIKNKGLNGYAKTPQKAPVSPQKPQKTTKPTVVPAKQNTSQNGLKKGDRVEVIKAVDWNGKKFKAWYKIYTVMEVKGKRVVIGVNNVVTAAISSDNLRKV